MPKVSEISNPYFSHDFYPQADKNIVKLLDAMGYEGYGLYWKIVEFMHSNELCVGEENLVAGKAFTDKVLRILSNFGLFRIEDNCYISDRILRNINTQEEKSKKAKEAVNVRWLLSELNSAYKEIFNEKPQLLKEEIEKLKQFDTAVEEFRKKLPDILYTLKKLKFKNNPDFKPGINWLLSENHLYKLLNGEYGAVLSWAEYKETQKRIAAKQAKEQAEQEAENANVFDLDTISSKAAAIQYISNNNKDLKLMIPDHKKLMRKFDITLQEIKSFREDENA